MKKKKYNLTVIDRHPEIENFLYRGVSVGDKEEISNLFTSAQEKVIAFQYDDGEAWILKEVIHTLVFSDYVSEQEDLDIEMQRPQDFAAEPTEPPARMLAHTGNIDDEDYDESGHG